MSVCCIRLFCFSNFVLHLSQCTGEKGTIYVSSYLENSQCKIVSEQPLNCHHFHRHLDKLIFMSGIQKIFTVQIWSLVFTVLLALSLIRCDQWTQAPVLYFIREGSLGSAQRTPQLPLLLSPSDKPLLSVCQASSCCLPYWDDLISVPVPHALLLLLLLCQGP